MGTISATEAAQREITRVTDEYELRVTATITRDWNPRTGEFDGKVIDATVTVDGTFERDDTAAYLRALRGCQQVLALCPSVRSGSTWGTDSGSVGGHAGLRGGFCMLSKSGVGIRLARRFA